MPSRPEPTIADLLELVGHEEKERRGDVVAKPSAKYVARARALAEAIDLAQEIRAATPHARDDEGLVLMELETKRMALDPEPPFANLKSLKHAEAMFFTYWGEGGGPEIEAFWRELERRKLPFQRVDTARAALDRGRIVDQVEYETVADAVSDERFSDAEKKKLGAMLDAYGTRAAKKHTARKR